jgi:hypothetical protein
MPSPVVTYKSDYVEQRSRLTTFFRLFMVIPHAIVWYVWAIGAVIAVIVAWFAVVFTGRYPRGLYDFLASFSRYQTRWLGYAHLLTDEYPPFSGSPDRSYPVDLEIGPPAAEYTRWKAALRLFLAIPVALIAYAMQLVAEIGAILAWFAIVVTGKQPKALQDMTNLGFSYYMRAGPYYGLLTEDWPSFTDEPRQVDPGPSGDQLSSGPEAPGPGGTFAPPQAPGADSGTTSGDPLG